MEKQITQLTELITACCHTANLLVKSEIALNDGEVDVCQKLVQDASKTMSVLVKDVFAEVQEMFNLAIEDAADYDIPNSLELASQLNSISYNGGLLVSMIIENEEDKIKKIVYKTLSKHIEAAIEIYTALFNN